MFDGLGFLPFLCSCVSVNIGLCQPHEEYGDFYSAKLITKCLEEKPVLTTQWALGAKHWCGMLGIQKWKVGLLCQTRSLVMEKAKVNTTGDNCKDGDGKSLCRAPGKRQTGGLTLLLPHLQASSLWGQYRVVLDSGPSGLFPGGVREWTTWVMTSLPPPKPSPGSQSASLSTHPQPHVL